MNIFFLQFLILEFHCSHSLDRLVLSQVTQQGDIPSARCGAASCVVDGCIFIFGGRTKEREKNLFSGNTAVSYHNTVHVFNPGMISCIHCFVISLFMPFLIILYLLFIYIISL
jgi:hypothetical protein